MDASPAPTRLDAIDDAVEHVIRRTRGDIRLGIPLGLGKPNHFVNALYRRAAAEPSIALTIYTALSLHPPSAKGDLGRRFMEPFAERVFGDYRPLTYVEAQRADELPPNIRVREFFFPPGEMLGSASAQQSYMSVNYSHVAAELDRLGINALAQIVARRDDRLSLSCNPDVTLDLAPRMARRRAAGEAIVLVGQIHRALPFMEGPAVVDPGFFDLLVDDPAAESALFGTPDMPVDTRDHCIGLHASGLVRDGGTLQIGIGALGDALAWHLLRRHRDNAGWRRLRDALDPGDAFAHAIDGIGGRDAFDEGVYGCSEMFTLGMLDLLEAGVIRRTVEGGVRLHAGFFLGPPRFYRRLRDLDPELRAAIHMTGVGFTNRLGDDIARKRAQRRGARFVNTAFTATLLGAAVSDQLPDGRVVSGVGGQYDFVRQAHALDDARVVMMLRSWRQRGGEAQSNLVFRFGHQTIPRHLRDVFVTEYGVADLRGRTDAECIAAMLAIADSRFQPALLEEAQAAGKIARDHAIPECHRHNTPERLDAIAAEADDGALPRFPLGSAFTDVEQALVAALGWLERQRGDKHYLRLGHKALFEPGAPDRFAPHLARMGLGEATGVRARLHRRLLLAALRETA